MTDAVIAVENSIDMAQAKLYAGSPGIGNSISMEGLGVVQAAQSIAPALVPVANPDAISDAVLVEVKKLLDFYGHDIPIWDEIVALAKKV